MLCKDTRLPLLFAMVVLEVEDAVREVVDVTCKKYQLRCAFTVEEDIPSLELNVNLLDGKDMADLEKDQIHS